jgi:hypothetical protein
VASSSDNLKKHLERHNNNDRSKWWLSCDACDRKYPGMLTMKKHIMRTHSISRRLSD